MRDKNLTYKKYTPKTPSVDPLLTMASYKRLIIVSMTPKEKERLKVGLFG